MNSARIFASRNHIIDWINHVLKIQMTKIQQLGSGVIYCLLLDSAYPGRIPISKIKWYANTEVDYIHNFKILQTAFCHLGIEKKIQINKLIKAKYQDNLDFIQWLKWFLQPKTQENEYDAVKRRQNRKVILDFCQHKILKFPTQQKYKYEEKKKYSKKINKKLKKTYNTNDQFLEIFQCKTEESDNQRDCKEQKSITKQKKQMLKTVSNFRQRKNLPVLNDFMTKSDDGQSQDNKQNARYAMNNKFFDFDQRMSVQCLYSSPKQIKKFYFPQRFSQRLKKRVDLINGLRKSQQKHPDRQSQNQHQLKNQSKLPNIFIDQQDF